MHQEKMISQHHFRHDTSTQFFLSYTSTTARSVLISCFQILLPFGIPRISGAIIVDTVLNFNSSVGSQDISKDMEKMPEMVKAIRENQNRYDNCMSSIIFIFLA